MPIASDVGVCHVVEANGFEVLYADDVAYSALVNHALESTEVRCIPQYVAHADQPSVLACLPEDVGTLFGGLGDRFLQEHIVARSQSLHTRFVMQIVGRSDDHRIGELRQTEHLRPIAEPVLGWYVVLLRHLFATNGIDVGYAYYLQRCRVLPAIRSIDRATRACTNDDGSNRSQHFCLLIRQTKREPLGIFRERFVGCSSLSCLHERGSGQIADS